jgi:hypothetical protein
MVCHCRRQIVTKIQHTIGARSWSSTVQHDIIVRLVDPTKPTRFEVTRGQQTVAIQVPPLKSPVPPPVSVVDAAYHGEPVNIVLDRNVGTLMAGYVYLGQYNNVTNCWSVTGYNAGAAHGVGTWTYCNAPHDKGNLSMWGAVFTFNNDGVVLQGGQPAGTIRLKG